MASQEEQVVAFRNFMIFGALGTLLLVLIVYLSGLLTTFLFYGKSGVVRIINLDMLDQITYLYTLMFRSWKILIQNFSKVGFTGSNYFAIKIFFGTFSVFSVVTGVMIKFREDIFKWRPFKVEESKHGTAHWASPAEIKKAGLMAKTNGLMMGKYRGKFLVTEKTNYQHALLFAPTGSGKGVGFVFPNLLFWEDSVIVHDVKLENYEVTSGFRSKKLRQKCYLWNPADQDGITHCYNPMDFIAREFGKQVDDVQKITKFLLPKEDFWNIEGRALVTGVMLALLADTERPQSMGEALRILRSDDVAYNIAVILDTQGEQIHPTGYMNLAAFLQKPDKERGSVCSTAASSLDLWSNPIVDAATMKSDFDLGIFRKVPTTLYVGISPSNVLRLQPLLQIFYQQCASIFTKRLPDKKTEKYGVLMLLDEFPTLGKMEEIRSGIAYYRGYWVKLFLITQDTEQLKSIYEASGMNSFLSNCTYRITFAANNVETADYISKLLGNRTITSVNEGARPKYLDLNPGARTVSTSESARALLMPQEVIGLPKDDQIILIEANPPVRCKKIKYYEDKFFTSRVLPKIFIPKQEAYIAKKQKTDKI